MQGSGDLSISLVVEMVVRVGQHQFLQAEGCLLIAVGGGGNMNALDSSLS